MAMNWELLKEQRWKIVFLAVLVVLFLLRPKQIFSQDTVFLIHFYFRYLIVISAIVGLVMFGRFLWGLSTSQIKISNIANNKPLMKKIVIGIVLVGFLVFLLDQWIRYLNLKDGAGIFFLMGEFFEDYADLTEPCFTEEKQLRDISDIVQWLMGEFQSRNLTCWIDYGTLLGAIRSNEIIYWDKDGDVGCLQIHRKAVEEILKTLPPPFTHREQKIGLSVDSKPVNVDIFFYLEKGDYFVRTDKVKSEVETSTNQIHKSFLVPQLATCRFGYKDKIKEVWCPNPPIKFLKMRYPNTYNKVVTRKFSCFWQKSPKANTELFNS
eukprot:TRINITY_DN4415_c0_g1_i1.p1 TRINITY_DN4415_c0_g1~~TRINITY_DN4415_c0_g1_i1.p1  ORF type:complete len:322 (-),score=65.97 TRINITY_DN4415_c0_g1_i1:345-1310(-)